MKPVKPRRTERRAGATATRNSEKQLKLSPNLTIYEAASVKDGLLNNLARRSVIELDLSQVVEIDTAGLQLLMLAERESRRQGKTLRISTWSPAVQELIQLYNLADLFGNAPGPSAPGTVQP